MVDYQNQMATLDSRVPLPQDLQKYIEKCAKNYEKYRGKGVPEYRDKDPSFLQLVQDLTF